MGSSIVVIRESKPQQCDLCGKIAELRPYGPKGECICFECGMKDKAAAIRALEARFNGTPVRRTPIEGIDTDGK